MDSCFQTNLEEHIEVFNRLHLIEGKFLEAAQLCIKALEKGNKLLIFGNGGSAADAQHFAAELTGRYKKERKGLAAIALTTDTSALTAIGNDYGYDKVFVRQVESLAKEGDILIGISTSGNSNNVLLALELGTTLGCKTIGLSGNGGGKMNDACTLNLVMPASNTPRIQEGHIFLIHTLCELIEDSFLS